MSKSKPKNKKTKKTTCNFDQVFVVHLGWCSAEVIVNEGFVSLHLFEENDTSDEFNRTVERIDVSMAGFSDHKAIKDLIAALEAALRESKKASR